MVVRKWFAGIWTYVIYIIFVAAKKVVAIKLVNCIASIYDVFNNVSYQSITFVDLTVLTWSTYNQPKKAL